MSIKLRPPLITFERVRLSAFILFCIGIQVLWTGVAELLQSLNG